VKSGIDHMNERLQQIIHESQDPEWAKRHAMGQQVSVTVGGVAKETTLHSLSKGGGIVLGRGIDVSQGEAFEIDLPEIGVVSAVLIAKTDDHTHARLELTDEQTDSFRNYVDTMA
ncbi:MAG: hypothetical protein RIB80_00025, partial [Rhodospirillales bacterium]